MVARPVYPLAIFSPIRQQFMALRFALGVALAAFAILLRALLEPVLGHVAFYPTIYMTVAYCAIVAGVFPAVLNAVIGFMGVFYWFVDPRHSVTIPISEVHGVVAFVLVCFVLILLGHANRNKQLRLNESIAALRAEAAERQRAEDDLRKAHDALEQRVQERTVELLQTLERLRSEMAVRERAQEQLRRLSVRLMTLQDEERRRIARDLHDSAGQTLSAMKLCIASLHELCTSPPKVSQLLDELNIFTDQTLKEVRTTSYLLHPPLLDEAGIASAARWFADGFSLRSGIQVSCEIPDNIQRPPQHCELALFRVLQESLTNVHRHSGASFARIRLEPGKGNLTLEVRDNGSGIPPERLARLRESTEQAGVGVAGMRERVREIGGQLEIHSDRAGTSITAVVPLPKAELAHAGATLSAWSNK